MSYLAHIAAVDPSPRLHGLIEDVAAAVTGGQRALQAGAIGTAADVLRDPALPVVIATVGRLHTATSAGGGGPGIGLSKVVAPLKLYVYTQEPGHEWVIPALVVVILGLPFMLGRMSKR